MGTKKGQVRKTARRAYEPKKKQSGVRTSVRWNQLPRFLLTGKKMKGYTRYSRRGMKRATGGFLSGFKKGE